MHEVGIMESVLQIAEAQARKSGASTIHEIRMRVGRMTGVVLESLDHAFAILKDGTMAASARLIVDEIPGDLLVRRVQARIRGRGHDRRMSGLPPAEL